MGRPIVFEYSDYRSFLGAYVSFRKSNDSRWSLGMWARSLGLKATTSITMVLNGQRHPGKKLSMSLVKYFKFNQKQSSYFLNLVQLSKIDGDDPVRALLKRELHELSISKKEQTVEASIFDMISDWYHIVIRQIARSKGIIGDSQWIQRNLRWPVPVDTIERAMDRLLALKFLVRSESGVIKCGKSPIGTKSDVPQEAVKLFHQQMLGLASKSLREVPVELREFDGVTLPISTKNIAKTKEMIQRFLDEFDSVVDEEGGDQVYHLAVQFFPVTQTPQINKAQAPGES